MEIYNHIIELDRDMSEYFDDQDVCFLDIETTGLSPKYNQIYLIGLMYPDKENQSWHLNQIFAHNLKDEGKVLQALNNHIDQFDLIITYNGSSFDLPFIHRRSVEYSIDSGILDIETFDIYRRISEQKPYLDFENLRLKTIEKQLGIHRGDQYSGRDCIDFYYRYMHGGDEGLRDRILKHNYDDLYYLPSIMNIFNHIRDVKSVEVPYKQDLIEVQIKEIVENEDILRIECKALDIDDHTDIIYYQDGFNINWRKDNFLTVELEFNKGMITPTRKCSFIYKDSMPAIGSLNDSSQFMVPENIILLKVENKYEMNNIKKILSSLIRYIFTEQNK
ncbi:MAG: ribonuclease H-like domain-containing protein [Tissierellia bacterium]|nr:ribonuclease H-like domain-containing protein [Tissierellia bacterium]